VAVAKQDRCPSLSVMVVPISEFASALLEAGRMEEILAKAFDSLPIYISCNHFYGFHMFNLIFLALS
jgi:hypothetical protein